MPKKARKSHPLRVWLISLPQFAPLTVEAHTAGEARAKAKMQLRIEDRLPIGTKVEVLKPAE